MRGRRAVDLVGHQELAEDRAVDEAEGARPVGPGLQHLGAEDVGRHQVGGELHPVRDQPEHRAERLDQPGLGEPRRAHEQAVAAAQDRDQRLLDHLLLADDAPRDHLARPDQPLAGRLDFRHQVVGVRHLPGPSKMTPGVARAPSTAAVRPRSSVTCAAPATMALDAHNPDSLRAACTRLRSTAWRLACRAHRHRIGARWPRTNRRGRPPPIPSHRPRATAARRGPGAGPPLEPAVLRRSRHAHRPRRHLVLSRHADRPEAAREALLLDPEARGRSLLPGDAGREGRDHRRRRAVRRRRLHRRRRRPRAEPHLRHPGRRHGDRRRRTTRSASSATRRRASRRPTSTSAAASRR